MEAGMIIEKSELYFLLSCKGCKCCPSLFRPQEEERPEAVLERLFRKGRISNTGERFRVERELADRVGQITEAEHVLCLCHGDRSRELLYLYPGERILAVQEMFPRKNALRLLDQERDGLHLFLEEQGLLGEEPGWEPRPCKAGMKTEELLPEQIQARSFTEAYPWIRLIAERAETATGRVTCQIGIVRTGFQEELLTADRVEETVERELYTVERFMEELWQSLGIYSDERDSGGAAKR